MTAFFWRELVPRDNGNLFFAWCGQVIWLVSEVFVKSSAPLPNFLRDSLQRTNLVLNRLPVGLQITQHFRLRFCYARYVGTSTAQLRRFSSYERTLLSELIFFWTILNAQLIFRFLLPNLSYRNMLAVLLFGVNKHTLGLKTVNSRWDWFLIDSFKLSVFPHIGRWNHRFHCDHVLFQFAMHYVTHLAG